MVTDILEADVNGCLPSDEAYNPNKGVSLLQYLGSNPSLVSLQLRHKCTFYEISKCVSTNTSSNTCTDFLQFFKLAKHPTLKRFVEFQWKKKGSRIFR